MTDEDLKHIDSNCCGAEIIGEEDSGICSACGEPCISVAYEELLESNQANVDDYDTN